jgi:hypothetical protein
LSRGLGKIQRTVLGQLAWHPANVYQLARAAYHLSATEAPSTAQLVAVRRAIRRLREAGFLLPPMRPPRTPPKARIIGEPVPAGNPAEARLRLHRIDKEMAHWVWDEYGWYLAGPDGRPLLDDLSE